jgi:hypothetical protein
MDRDLDGIIVTSFRKPQNLAGAIERRIYESLQIKQGQILAPDLAPPAGTQISVPLHAELKEAESSTRDPKLRNQLVAVVRYSRYFDDLKVLKTACKGYQTQRCLSKTSGASMCGRP